jgi:hypothetical protein
MELIFKVTLPDEQIEAIKDSTGMESLEQIAEWLAECYHSGAATHLYYFGANPKIDPASSPGTDTYLHLDRS